MTTTATAPAPTTPAPVVAIRPVDAATAPLVAATLRRRAWAKIWRVVLGVGFPALLLLAWEIAAAAGMIDRRFFPAPSKIGASIVDLLANPTDRAQLGEHVLATFWRLLIGYGVGATAGIALGVLMGLSAGVRNAVSPILYGLFPLPKIAIYPLVIVIFGIGDASTAALVMLGVFFMTCINTLAGVLYTQPIYQDVATAFRMPPLTRWFRVIIPSAMPAIITGARLGLGQALILVISAEFVSGDSGVGRLIWDSWQVLNIPRMFVGLFVILIFGGLAAWLGDYAEKKLIPWKQR